MAKKSARSRGFRKAVSKKPYLTKKEIIALCAMIAVVAVGAILLFTYDDGALKVKDGHVIDAGENWLIVNGSASGGRRYYKVGEVGELEGYSLDPEASLTDENVAVFNYTPIEEGSGVTLSVNASPAKPDRTASYYHSMIAALNPTEVASGNAGGAECQYFTYENAYYAEETSESDRAASDVQEPATEAEEPGDENAPEPEPNHYEQVMRAFFPGPRSYTIGVSVQVKGTSESDRLTDEQLLELAGRAFAAVKPEA